LQRLVFWIAFNLFVVIMLVLDLVVFHRKAHKIGFREAMAWTTFWIALAAAFAVGVHFWYGKTKALEFVTGYVIEESLSVDNLFVFLLIFNYFKVPERFQHKVLFWGIIGALVMRGVFILVGVSLMNRFEWIVYIFGAILIWSGISFLRGGEKEVHPENNPVLKQVRRWIPVTKDYVDGKFFVRDPGLYATPLFLVLLMIETTDVVFAADSIPAVLAISRDPFIVYTSNVFAILGLRSLYFALSGMMTAFHYLQYGLAMILLFIGTKMVLSHFYHIPIGIALGTVGGILGLSVVASLVFPQKVPGG
jgi:tellurite resistance protein TerC